MSEEVSDLAVMTLKRLLLLLLMMLLLLLMLLLMMLLLKNNYFNCKVEIRIVCSSRLVIEVVVIVIVVIITTMCNTFENNKFNNYYNYNKDPKLLIYFLSHWPLVICYNNNKNK